MVGVGGMGVDAEGDGGGGLLALDFSGVGGVRLELVAVGAVWRVLASWQSASAERKRLMAM